MLGDNRSQSFSLKENSSFFTTNFRQLSDLNVGATWRHGSHEDWITQHDEFRTVLEFLDAPSVCQLALCSKACLMRFFDNDTWEMIVRRDLRRLEIIVEPMALFPNPFYLPEPEDDGTEHKLENINPVWIPAATLFELVALYDGPVQVPVDCPTFTPVHDRVVFELQYFHISQEELAQRKERHAQGIHFPSDDDFDRRYARAQRGRAFDLLGHSMKQGLYKLDAMYFMYRSILTYFNHPYQIMLERMAIPLDLRQLIQAGSGYTAELREIVRARGKDMKQTEGFVDVLEDSKSLVRRLVNLTPPFWRQQRTMSENQTLMVEAALGNKDQFFINMTFSGCLSVAFFLTKELARPDSKPLANVGHWSENLPSPLWFVQSQVKPLLSSIAGLAPVQGFLKKCCTFLADKKPSWFTPTVSNRLAWGAVLVGVPFSLAFLARMKWRRTVKDLQGASFYLYVVTWQLLETSRMDFLLFPSALCALSIFTPNSYKFLVPICTGIGYMGLRIRAGWTSSESALYFNQLSKTAWAVDFVGSVIADLVAGPVGAVLFQTFSMEHFRRGVERSDNKPTWVGWVGRRVASFTQ